MGWAVFFAACTAIGSFIGKVIGTTLGLLFRGIKALFTIGKNEE